MTHADGKATHDIKNKKKTHNYNSTHKLRER